MPGPSDVLRQEHETIQHLLEVLEAMAEAVERQEAVRREDLEAALDVAVGFTDRCHHAKEERALFPALRRASPEDGGLLARRLEGDYKAARQLVAAMQGSISGVAAGDAEARRTFAKLARTHAGLLREHIAQETMQLLPMTDALLSEEERTALGEVFEQIEREETAPGTHERYEEAIRRLADAYGHRGFRIH